MQEALEKWDLKLIKKVSPKIANIIIKIDSLFNNELKNHQIAKEFLPELQIIQNNTVHMAYLACYCSSYINGVAKIHTEILKTKVLKQWYLLYPSKFQNKTNGITQRRWLGLCNIDTFDSSSNNPQNPAVPPSMHKTSTANVRRDCSLQTKRRQPPFHLPGRDTKQPKWHPMLRFPKVKPSSFRSTE